MKKIGFYTPDYSLPVPAVGGGAVEELIEILIDENEKKNNFKFMVYQPYPTKDQLKRINENYKYSNTELIFVKSNKFLDFFLRVINKFFRIIKSKKRIDLSYDRRCLKIMKNSNLSKIVFEGNIPANIYKYKKSFKKDDLYFHLHSQYQKKPGVSENIGNLIGVSKFILNDWDDFFERTGEVPTKNHLLINCVRNKKFANSISEDERTAIRQKMGYTENDFVVIFCGRILEIKGIEELMNAVVNIENANIKLMVIGSPNFSRKVKTDFLTKIENLVKQNEEKIKFTGYIDNSELYKYYQSADMHVVPSTYDDPAPLVVIEGLKSAMPQICTISGGVPEYVNQEGTILLDKNTNLEENLQQSILKIYNDKDLQNKMKNINRQQGKKFNENKFYDDFTMIMEKKL